MEENKAPQTETPSENEAQMYIDAINEMKANSVPREDYDRIREENRKLLNSLVTGRTNESDAPAFTEPDIEELKRQFAKEDQNNLEFWQNTLALRDALINSGKPDPFLPYGPKIAPTAEDVEKANNVAAVVRECIDYADGDSEIFTTELMRRTVDVAPPRRR